MAANGTNGAGRRLIVWWFGCVAAAMVVVAVGVWLVAHPGGGMTPSATGRSDTNGATVAGSPDAPTPTSTSGAAPGQTGATTPASPAATVRSEDAGEGPTQPPADAAPQEQPVRLPGAPPAPHVGRYLVSRPLPANAQAHGRLVAGYPSTVLPTPRWVQVRRSSVASSGSTVQISLQARSARRANALLEHYRSALIARGFGVFPAQALGTEQAERFSRRADSVVVTVDPRRSTYSLYAVLHAAPPR